jgi:hypothetical protein
MSSDSSSVVVLSLLDAFLNSTTTRTSAAIGSRGPSAPGSSSPPPIRKKSKINSNTTIAVTTNVTVGSAGAPPREKFLFFYTHSGLSNQLKGLQHAAQLACWCCRRYCRIMRVERAGIVEWQEISRNFKSLPNRMPMMLQ